MPEHTISHTNRFYTRQTMFDLSIFPIKCIRKEQDNLKIVNQNTIGYAIYNKFNDIFPYEVPKSTDASSLLHKTFDKVII